MGSIWSKSGSLELDNDGQPAIGATAEFFQGGTTTPLEVFQDADEGTPHEDPVEADGYGRWPFVSIPFCASYDVKVTTDGGTQLYYYRELPNPDPIEASEDSVDDAELIQTGDIIFSPKTGTRTGFVRANARTIGSASSGATERANADTEDLYTFNWNNFANGILAVATGRGASAAADFAANKAIALLDGRAATLRGVDDMGNTAASLLGSATFTTGDATTGGSVAGANTHVITEAQLPNHTHTFSATSGSDGAHTHTATTSSDGAHTHTGSTGSGGAHTHTGTTDSGGSHTHTGTTDNDSPDHTHNYSDAQIGASNAVASIAAQQVGNTDATRTTGGASARHTHTFTTASGGAHTHTFTTSSDGAHTHSISSDGAHTHTLTTSSNGAHTHTVSGTTGTGSGSGSAHNNVSRSILGNWLQKL